MELSYFSIKLGVDLYLIIDFYSCFLSGILSFNSWSLYFQIESLIVFYSFICRSEFFIMELFEMNCFTQCFKVEQHFLIVMDKIFIFQKLLLNLRFLAKYQTNHYFHFVPK